MTRFQGNFLHIYSVGSVADPRSNPGRGYSWWAKIQQLSQFFAFQRLSPEYLDNFYTLRARGCRCATTPLPIRPPKNIVDTSFFLASKGNICTYKVGLFSLGLLPFYRHSEFRISVGRIWKSLSFFFTLFSIFRQILNNFVAIFTH